MCDNHAFDDMADHLRRTGGDVTRRRFGAMAAGAGLMAALPRAAGALDVVETDVEIATPDGVAEAYYAFPAAGQYPGVLVWADAFGLRPAFRQMGRRLAESGFAVLIPNPYYRTAKVPALPEGLSFQNPDDRARIMALMQTLSPTTQVTDAHAYVNWLDGQAAVDPARKMGTTGYCMGGPPVMRTAAELPGRIGAGATFHGGGLATAQPDSPHLLVPKMKAQFLIAIAENDDAQEPQVKTVLRDSFDAAGLPAEIEVYEGTLHGWCPPDHAVYNEAQAERAWSRMLALFERALA